MTNYNTQVLAFQCAAKGMTFLDDSDTLREHLRHAGLPTDWRDLVVVNAINMADSYSCTLGQIAKALYNGVPDPNFTPDYVRLCNLLGLDSHGRQVQLGFEAGESYLDLDAAWRHLLTETA